MNLSAENTNYYEVRDNKTSEMTHFDCFVTETSTNLSRANKEAVTYCLRDASIQP